MALTANQQSASALAVTDALRGVDGWRGLWRRSTVVLPQYVFGRLQLRRETIVAIKIPWVSVPIPPKRTEKPAAVVAERFKDSLIMHRMLLQI